MRTKLTAAIIAISVAAIGGVAGGTAASASSGGGRMERLRLVSTTAASDRLSAIATGAFTSGGYDIPGAVTDTVVFPGGTFAFRHVRHGFKASFNPSTCLLTETVRGTFTLAHGTGRYSGLRGSGTFVTSIVAVTAKNQAGRCTHVQAPATFQGITTAAGTVGR